MGNQAEYSSGDESKIYQLEKEITSLQAEIKSLRAKNESAPINLPHQSAIEESQLRFKTIFDHSTFGMTIIAPNLQTTQVNKVLEKMLGYSEKELKGTKITDYAHPDYREQWHSLQQNLWEKKISSFQLDARLLKKDDSSLWCSVTTILVTDKDSTLEYTIVEDISERKAFEEYLKKQVSMVNADLEDFLYTASHELKSPIVNIEGLIFTLIKKLTQKFSLDDEHNKMFSMIGASIDKFKSTITQLAQTIQVQKEEAEAELISIDKLVEEVCSELSELINHSHVKLHKQIEVDKIQFPQKNIRRILYNLLSNAIKYNSQERIPEVQVKTQLQESYVVITVADNGMGIAENHQQKLFTLFNRFHTHVDGTGIGLYMVKRIVENAGGKIEVKSKVDMGATFQVYLPYQQ